MKDQDPSLQQQQKPSLFGGLFIVIVTSIVAVFQGCGTPPTAATSPPTSLGPTPTWKVKSFSSLVTYAMRPQWSFDGEWIIFDRMYSSTVTGSSRWQIYRIRPDGTGMQCLTCDRTGNPGNNGGPHLSPDGRFLLFSAEKLSHPALPVSCPTCSDPGAGLYNDVAVMDMQTFVITRLTNVSADALSPGGSMHPRFSYDGTKVMWSDFERATSELADYQIAVADFSAASGTPVLSNVTYYNPGGKPEMMESQGFSADGTKVYFTCTAFAGQSDLSADICELDLATQNLKRISESAGINGEAAAYEEHGAMNPVHNIFVYMGTGSYGVDLTNLNFLSWIKTDLWIRDLSKNEDKQMTFFNTPGHTETTGSRMLLSKMGWDPTGTRLVVSTWDYKTEGISSDDFPEIKILTFALE